MIKSGLSQERKADLTFKWQSMYFIILTNKKEKT